MLALTLDTIPWTEIIAATGVGIALLLKIGNSKLKKIYLETKVNGGSSLKDQMNRIETSINTLAVWVEASQHLTSKPMFKADENGKFTWVNLAFARMLGLGIEDVKGYGWLNFVDPSDVERVSLEWGSSVKDKRKFESVFKVINAFDGQLRSVRARSFPVFMADKPVGFLGTWMFFDEVVEA